MAEAVRSRKPKSKSSQSKEKKKRHAAEGLNTDKVPLLEKETDIFSKVLDVDSSINRDTPDYFTEIQLNDETVALDVNRLNNLPPSLTVTGEASKVSSTDFESKDRTKELDKTCCTNNQVQDPAGSKKGKTEAHMERNKEVSEDISRFSEMTLGTTKEKMIVDAEDIRPAILALKEQDHVNPQHFVEAKEILQLPQAKSLYPELPVEIVDHKRDVATIKPLPQCERLYPEVPQQPKPLPFTKEQLKIFEPCSWLENVESFTEEFESIVHQDRHEFHELLMNYGRCRKQLLLAEAKLQIMVSDWKNIKSKVWDFKEEHMTVQGLCEDQAKVVGYHHYQTAEINASALGDLKRLFELKSDHLHQTFALHSYTSVLSRLQVESYIYALVNNSPFLRSVAVYHADHGSHKLEGSLADVVLLKECISVLFSFTRRIIEDSPFQNDILLWLQKLVSVLLKVGSLGDHLFLLNHILRCPAGINKWAAPFVQVRVLHNPAGVFHFMQLLAVLMCPVRNRTDYLCHMKPNEKKASSGKESGNWTLVDEGGEEDEEPETSWMLLSEDDLIALLSQFPFHDLFKTILGFNSRGDYFPEKTTPQEMMKIFAFANSLVDLLALGLETFNRARYRQFVKRIGRIIRMTLCYVSDHWALYLSNNCSSNQSLELYSVEKLQAEYDELFLRAVLHVLKAKRLGIWLFMSEMPYGTLSNNMLWKLFYLMHNAEREDVSTLQGSVDGADCIARMNVPENREKFECYLSTMNSSEGICLLTTFAQMTQTMQKEVDIELVKSIALEIYEVSYVGLSTRETFSKVGRELLATITGVHTEIISVLLERVRQTIDKVGMVSLYLFKELPLHRWSPTSSEISVIREWLLSYNLADVENKLACIILEGLNWGYNEKNSLYLDASVHVEVALMVLEAYQKYISDKPYTGIISESIKQVSYLASIVRTGQTPEAAFNQWAWDLVLRLKLHRKDRREELCDKVPDLTEVSVLHPVLKAVKSGVPIGCYIALAAATVGHSVDKFCAEGVVLLGDLVQARHLRAAVHILDKVLPMFYSCQFYLLKNEQFLSHIQLFLQLDNGVPQGITLQMTHKVTQHLTGINYGENVKLLTNLILGHIFESTKPNGVGPSAVLEFWTQVLISQQLWHRDKGALHLMDQLCKVAFRYMQEDCVHKLLYQQHKDALGYHCDRGLLSSFVGWIVAGNITPSFIDSNYNPSQIWFSWTVLNTESLFEEDSQLRRVVEWELISNPSISPDQALKKAQQQLKLPIVPSIQRLMIYRWAHQAMATPADHPLLPLFWQKFFLLYLNRPGPQYGLPVEGCIGKRFFSSPAHTHLLKQMKRRLMELADFHHSASKALRVLVPMDGSPVLSDSGGSTQDCMMSPDLHKELVKLFNVFIVWLDEESFQKGDVYIPSLPKQYDTHRLAKIMRNEQSLWMEFVNMERIIYEIQESVNTWTKIKLEMDTSLHAPIAVVDPSKSVSAKERILMNLRKHSFPCPGITLQLMKPPVPVIPSSCYISPQEAMKLVHKDLTILQQHAKSACMRESQQVAVDGEMLDTIPKLYINREEQIEMKMECRGNLNKSCSGPAVVTVKFEGMQMDEAISQQLHILRREMKQLQAEATKPTALNIIETAVHLENFITALVNSFKVKSPLEIQKIGIATFFAVVEYVCDDTQRHPPSRQFFTSCIEILGQVFISGTQSECRPVLDTILQNRRLCTLLSPYFTPAASPTDFVHLYEKVVQAIRDDNSDVIFMLLTKFDLNHWLNSAKPSMSERTKLIESVHLALTLCGLVPEEDMLMPFNIFCKHWNSVFRYQFPDHYSDCLRLLMQSSADQLLSPECWKTSLKAIGCYTPRKPQSTIKPESADPLFPGCANKLMLSSEQVLETIKWLSDFFYKLRFSKPDFQSFGLLSKWNPYISEMKIFFEYLVKSLIDYETVSLKQEPMGSHRVHTVLKSLHSVITELFKPWLMVLDKEDNSNQRCYPWLESDTSVAIGLVQLFGDCILTLHLKSQDHLLPGQHGALWLHLMHYCESCTAPKLPEYILYAYHMEYSKLPWKDMYPDQTLMEEFFKVERGSPKSCFLFLGAVLCEVNWMSILSDCWGPAPHPETHRMMVCLLFMLVFLAKEEKLINEPGAPLLNLLGQASTLSWHLVDAVSYQNVVGYFSSHYPPSVILSNHLADELVLKLLKVSAGLTTFPESNIYSDVTPKCRIYIQQVVQFLGSLEQNSKITAAALEKEMSKLLDDIVIFTPPDLEVQKRHMALSSLFMELLMLMNNASVTTAESLRGSLVKWIDNRVQGLLVMPLLTAACQSLASIKHMAEATEACILAYFKDETLHNLNPGWGPILASLQVPELTTEEFLQECLSLGSYLTLHVYVLQCLNREQTLVNEMRVLVKITKWLEQAQPNSVNEEPKLFLWWHKALQLSLIQVEQNDSIVTESVLRVLLSVQSRLSLLGEERITSGILGAIGLGRKSPLSARFRVIARSLAAFILAQIPSENQIRLKAGSGLHLSPKAQQALSAVESMTSNKQYAEYEEQISQAAQFIRYPGHCLQDGITLLALLINSLYPEVHYLNIIR
ncbi:LOW QUALITY PROTEIN: ectopic P granules protein 5 homolog [Bombina bombina]|uniref:LOW QUALITY PROTEIN: ectopic P granules protein 5 homolog n=1 Tax=Bombina bombina TaxID=8345 RepID=UPI00235A5C6D|nr:LOW QUALITY PROTEIN: ectopic P granules protein 5 homolog [Bombina bombina]